MARTNEDLRREIDKGLEAMRTLRDEVRVRLHLAGMDVKDEWNKLEPHLMDVERAAGALTEATRSAVTDALSQVKKLRNKLS